MRQNMKNIVLDDNINYVYVNLPKFKIENIVDHYNVVIPRLEKQLQAEHYYWHRKSTTLPASLKEFQEWKSREKDSISFMVKEFEMRKSAETYARINFSNA
jgi:hypothetical protein